MEETGIREQTDGRSLRALGNKRARGNKREGDRACLGLGGDAPLDTTFAPQAVLINLGGNDYGKPPKCPTTQQWVQHYPWFVGNISAT